MSDLLSLGSKGREVLTLQKCLKDDFNFSITCDGDFGMKTLRFLLWAQHRAYYSATGEVHLDSLHALVSAKTTFPEGRYFGNCVAIAALEDVGLAEVPKGSNAGPFIQHITGGNAYPWCAAAVSRWITESQVSEPGMTRDKSPIDRRIWAVGELWDILFENSGDRIGHPTCYETGDLAFMTRSGSGSDASEPGEVPDLYARWPKGSGDRKYAVGHVGIVVGGVGDVIYTVEGNMGDKVSLCIRTPSELVGIGDASP